MLRRASFVSALLFVVVACSSIPDLRFDEDPTTPEGGIPETSTIDSGRDSGTDTGVPDTSVPCVKTGDVEICDDDIDNDCNGTKDCADPMCGGGYACTAPPPDGWTLVAFVETTPPACPTGFINSTDLRVLNGVATHTCPCTCNGSGGSGATCAGATTAVTTGDDNACANGQTMANLLSSTAGVCTALPNNLQMGSGGPPTEGFAQITSPAGPAVCNPVASIGKTDPTDGRSCAAPSKLGTGCTGTNRCAPKATGFELCISKDGDQACPTGFTAKKRRAGTTSSDLRVCGTCTCDAPTACTGGTIDLFDNNACPANKVSKLTQADNSTCGDPANTGTAAKNLLATHYKSSISGGCGAPVGNTATGALTFGGERTICCK